VFVTQVPQLSHGQGRDAFAQQVQGGAGRRDG
jgi:hypothetical protein